MDGSSGRDRDGRTELTPDSAMVIGSVTKTYVAATILQLVEEGAVAARRIPPTSASPSGSTRAACDGPRVRLQQSDHSGYGVTRIRSNHQRYACVTSVGWNSW